MDPASAAQADRQKCGSKQRDMVIVNRRDLGEAESRAEGRGWLLLFFNNRGKSDSLSSKAAHDIQAPERLSIRVNGRAI